MPRGAWNGIIEDPVVGRREKPRREGLTMVIDKSAGMAQVDSWVSLVAACADYWKLPFGTAALYPTEQLIAKVRRLQAHGLLVYPGGTFLEIAVLQGKLEAFLARCQEIGFDAVEVSDGTVPISSRMRHRTILRAKACGFEVLTEVGRKDTHEHLTASQIHRTVNDDLSAGASWVIVEGRESGAGVGIYDPSGEIAEDEFLKVVHAAGDVSRLIWEAPRKNQQEELIRRFGPNVNLGNVPPDELLALECLRRGLRADTLRLTLSGAMVDGADETSMI